MHEHEFSRRALLGAAGTFAVGAGLGGEVERSTAPNASLRVSAGSSTRAPIEFYGTHQAGITTPPQARAVVAAFDVTTDALHDVVELMHRWTDAAAELTAGRPVGAAAGGFASTTGDSGEALGLGPARLTLTFGLGPGLFSEAGQDRFGLAAQRPAPLVEIPPFVNDQLDPQRSGGDLCVQACADDPVVAFHAVRNLVELGRGAVVPRWAQLGFGRTARSGGQTPRNLMGFKDGTNNLNPADPDQMRRNVWADGRSPRWMQRGTYMVVRRIRMRIEHWDASALSEQERTIGREKVSGAPLGAKTEFAPVRRGALPSDAHIMQANPRTAGSERERILRRGYSFVDGIDSEFREVEAGLLFICFQQDPRRQFVAIQSRLATHDHLSEYVFHTGSAIFAIPPGTTRHGMIGQELFRDARSA